MGRAISESSSKLIRLNKYISQSGVTSRRKADELIDSGLVKINGKTTYEMGIKIDPTKDKITVKGKPINLSGDKVYFIFNKPKSVLTTMNDPEGRPCIADFLKKMKTKRLFPVGRLDWDTEGLLLLTNDGEFSQRVTHPSSEVPKVYLAKLSGSPTQAQLKKLESGVSIVGGRVKAVFAEKVIGQTSKKYDWVRIAITEGKNRQIKKMFEKIGFDVRKLKRVSIGQLKLSNLKSGTYAQLNEFQIEKIFASMKIVPKKTRAVRESTPSRSKEVSTKKTTTAGRKKTRSAREESPSGSKKVNTKRPSTTDRKKTTRTKSTTGPIKKKRVVRKKTTGSRKKR